MQFEKKSASNILMRRVEYAGIDPYDAYVYYLRSYGVYAL